MKLESLKLAENDLKLRALETCKLERKNLISL